MKIIFKVIVVVLACSVHAFSQTLNDALRLTDNEQYEAASAAYQALIAKEPNNATYYYYFGENYLLNDNPDSALNMFEAGAKADPANPLILIGRAKYKLNFLSMAEMKRNSNMAADDVRKIQAEFDKSPTKSTEEQVRVDEMKARAGEAEALYQTAVANVKEANILIDEAIAKAGTKNAEVYMEAADALIHFKNKDLDKAKLLLDQAAALQPKNADIKILFGDIYSEKNNGTLAADYYNQALDLNPKAVRAIVNKGRLYKRSTNYEGAAEEFKNAIKIEESFAPAHRELGESFYRLGKLEDAKSEYRRYLELSKNNCSARIRYASFLYLSKDYPAALNEISQLRNTCDANSPTLLRVTAYSLYETKDSAKALVAVQKLFEKVSEEKLIGQDYEYFGKIYSMNAMDSLAVEKLRKAFMMDNTRCDLLAEMFKGYEKMKKYADASAVMLEKINNCKGATVADYFNLGRSFFFSAEYLRADSAFLKVNELSPKYASGFLWRAKANSFIDSTMTMGLAKPHYEKYIEVANTDSVNAAKYKSGLLESYRYLAAYNVQIQKDNRAALDVINNALELDPENAELKEWKKSLEYELDPKNRKQAGGK